MTINTEIKSHHSNCFRRAYIKRRLTTTGLFETDWQEITNDIKKWGKIKTQVDAIRTSKFKFSIVSLQVANDGGLYNPENDDNSLWNGYLPPTRSLVKVETGYSTHSVTGGLWTNSEFPSVTTSFIGVLAGDMIRTDSNVVTLKCFPLTEVFRDFPARNLVGLTSGLTASTFIDLLRDQTDGSANFIFRPFFGDTTTNWITDSTTITYDSLNTSTAEGVINKNVWQLIEQLAEAEQFVPYVNRVGQFNFVGKSANTSTASFEFFGLGTSDGTYGHTIKQITKFGKDISKYHSRVEVKFDEASTSTSYAVVEATLAVSGNNSVWNYGYKTLKIENLFINTLTVANSIATQVFNVTSVLKNEIMFTTSFIPHLEILDKVAMNYDSNETSLDSFWDLNDWQPVIDGGLYWDRSQGDSIALSNAAYKIYSIELDLDKLETKFTAREI